MNGIEIFYGDDGRAGAIYSDEVLPFFDGADVEIRRASHVEPCDGGGWQADMSPVDGPLLPVRTLRSEALADEVQWLREHRLGAMP